MAKCSEKDIKELLNEKILILDGAMGTNLQSQLLTEDDFGGAEYYGCNEHLILTKPSAIENVHRGFLEAGADIIESCTFGSTPLVLAEYSLGDKAYEISKKGAELARRICDEYETSGRPRLVAGSVGPTTRSLSVTGGVTFDELVENFLIQTRGLMDGGSDLLLIETAQDTLNLKAAIVAVRKFEKEIGYKIPIMISGTIEATGTMLAGQGVEAMVSSLEHLQPLSFGINCATGPAFMTDHIRSISSLTKSYVSCYPNAGLPDENGKYNESPESVAGVLARFCDEGWLNVIGGCCGTTYDHIAAMANAVKSMKPRHPKGMRKSYVSGIDYLQLEDDARPYLIGERTNSLGSRAFKRMIAEGKYAEASEIARRQVRGGAHVIDVCLQNPDRDEESDMNQFLPVLLKKIRAPLMIDSTNINVLALSLKYIQGKAIYNSVNLEEGEEKFAKVAPLYHEYGFALVVGCIDEDKTQGMGVTVDRKLAIAERSYKILTEKYNIDPCDIIFDPLVFPVATGDEQYIGSAEATILAVKAIKEKFPECKTTMGLSNVSFGLPEAGREVLNSVFLYHNVQAGLDLPIVNPEKLMRYPSIPDAERKLAEELIFHTRESYEGALNRFAEFYKTRKSDIKDTMDRSHLTVEEWLELCILEGSIDGLIELLDRAREKYTPIDIVNGPLMKGMAEVGRLFNANQLIVAEVLQSAETMKKAVSHLEQFMEVSDTARRGKMLLATVKGDVHDIGKNLVDIILSNNGFEVVNLGIKFPPEELIAETKKHHPDMIGLSGLLVKSAEQMIVTAKDMKSAGLSVPILVGGAALSEQFVRTKIAPVYDGSVIYAKDAMEGLAHANALTDPVTKNDFLDAWKFGAKAANHEDVGQKKDKPDMEPRRDPSRQPLTLTYDYGKDGKPNVAPDYDLHRLYHYPLEKIFPFVNPGMIYKKHLGFRGSISEALNNHDPKFKELQNLIESVEKYFIEKDNFNVDGVYRFFRAASDGNDLLIFDPTGEQLIERFSFRRQSWGWEIALSDFVAPLSSGIKDSVAFFVVTSGVGVREESEKLRHAGEYLKSHAVAALALESAEAFAEYLHKKIREEWGIPDSAETTPKDCLSNRYQGCRFSFGYPACPDLSMQEALFKVMDLPEDFSVKLTEGFSMDPEASVSAMVFQHPQARYFSVEDEV